jgi:hypothetical protein
MEKNHWTNQLALVNAILDAFQNIFGWTRDDADVALSNVHSVKNLSKENAKQLSSTIAQRIIFSFVMFA